MNEGLDPITIASATAGEHELSRKWIRETVAMANEGFKDFEKRHNCKLSGESFDEQNRAHVKGRLAQIKRRLKAQGREWIEEGDADE